MFKIILSPEEYKKLQDFTQRSPFLKRMLTNLKESGRAYVLDIGLVDLCFVIKKLQKLEHKSEMAARFRILAQKQNEFFENDFDRIGKDISKFDLMPD